VQRNYLIIGSLGAVGDSCRCIEAGFDKVEFHLIMQFLKSFVINKTNKYKSTMEDCMRFLLMIVQAVTVKIGGDRLCNFISPFTDYAKPEDANRVAVGISILQACPPLFPSVAPVVISKFDERSQNWETIRHNSLVAYPQRAKYKTPH